MDWRSILEEQRKRHAQGGTVVANQVQSNDANTQEVKPKDDHGGGFFGDISNFINDSYVKPAEGIAGFFGNLVKGVVDPAVGAATTAGTAIASDIADMTGLNSDIKKTEDKGDQQTQQAIQQAIQKGKDTSLSDDERGRWQKLAMKWSNEQDSTLKDRGKDLKQQAEKLDPVKFVANAGETAINVLSAGELGAAKGIAKEGIKTAVEQGGKAAAKTIATNVGKGAALGTGYGALEPLRTEGTNVNPQDIWQSALFGGATGGALGGAGSLLSKNVRAGLKEIPGEVKQGAADFKANLPQGAGEAGFIKNPFGPDEIPLNNTGARPKAELQKALEDAHNSGDDAEVARITKELNDPGLSATPLDPQTRDGILAQVKDGAPISVDNARVSAATPDWAPGGIHKEPTAAEAQSEQTSQEVASHYNSPEQYLNERAKILHSEESQLKGGQKIDTGSPDDPYTANGGVKRITEHSQWYRDHFAQTGRAPSQAATKDVTEQALNGTRPGVLDPGEERVYQILKDKEDSFNAHINDPSAAPPAGQFDEFQAALQGNHVPQSKGSAKPPARMPAGLPKGPGQTAPLEGMAPEAAGAGPKYDDPGSVQQALGAKEAQTNPAVDFVDPAATTAPPPTPGAQTALDTAPTDPYAGMPQDLTRPALPAGDGPPAMTLAEARAHFKKTGETPTFVHTVKETKNPLEMPATVDEGSNVAIRQTKAGKLVPVATNNAHITNDAVAGIRAIAEDNTSGAFTSTRTPEMNLEEALRKRGGTKSPEFQALNARNVQLREHTAQYTEFVDQKRSIIEKFRSDYGLDKSKDDPLTRAYIEAPDEATSKATMDEFRSKYGDKQAEGLQKWRDFWRPDNKIERTDTNKVIKTFAGEDRMIGDLGETYSPRVYKRGVKGFKDSVLDVTHGGMDKLKNMMNLENPGGYLSKETETQAGALRSVNQAPLNSNLAKPNTTFLSAAQERTANAPIKDLEDPYTSAMRWYESVGKAKYLTPDIAEGRTLQKAIEGVNGETGNLRQMYDSINDQINAVAGKTSGFDTRLVNTEAGNKFVNVASKLQSNIARSTILGSANSALAQTGQLPLVVAENGAKNTIKGLADVVSHLRSRGEGPISGSSLMKTRYPNYDELFTTGKVGKLNNKGTKIVAKPFRIVERAASEAAWYSSYNRVLGEGLTGTKAIQEADRITAKIIGERSPGARAALYESKALGPVTSYTLEVNQMYQVAKQYFKRDPKKAAMLVGAIWLYNQGYSAITGNKLNADPLAAAGDAGNILTNDKLIDSNGNPIGMGERLVRAGGRLAGEAVDATPLGGQIAGTLYPANGIRVPFGGGDRVLAKADIFGGTNLGRYGSGPPIASGLSNPLLALGIPGMNQLQKSVEGNQAYNEGGLYDKNGDPKFTIDQNNENYWRSLLWGIYNTPEGQAYLKDRQTRLTGSQ